MSDKKSRDVSAEDLEMFEALLVSHYNLPLERSLAEFERETTRLLQRDINRAFRKLMEGEAHDLFMEVYRRYAEVYGEMRRAGVSLDSFEAMLKSKVKHVRSETLRRYIRSLRETNPDEIRDLPHPDTPIDREFEDEEERLILLRCQLECLKKLPEHIQSLLLEYYDTESYHPDERAEMRRKLALRLANLSADTATPEQTQQEKDNLDSKISKWRSGRLRSCLEKCLRRAKSPRWTWRGRR